MIRQNFNHRNPEGNYVPVNYYVSEYNSPNELKNRRLYQVESGGDVLLQTEEFFYENGLMVKVEVKGQNEQSNKTYFLEYDNKNNPFSETQFGYFEKYGYPYKHNVTKTSALDYKGQVIADASHTISYTYNQQGYPLTLTGLSQSNRRWDVAYTYNCK
ncbi:hypothetical protein ABID22_004139 [Pontibacter aydingkolensis]|uniref:UPF0236 family protein n=1 Tax=Pontibacter aydingkolensis TaxID=1911536 RepID=A0ABS7D1M8_9BACT|nr:UPF0236 family protein [Pontibacter aydingkolensis]MBW7469362.1 UPF0236 family protein [Pontibacter aydingkolensis]